MFVRKKTVNGKEFYYLVENARASGKVRQKVLSYLGEYSTVDSALQAWNERLSAFRTRLAESEQGAQKAREEIPQALINRYGGRIPKPKGAGASQCATGRYWYHTERAQDYRRRIQELEERIAKLEALRGCSA